MADEPLMSQCDPYVDPQSGLLYEFTWEVTSQLIGSGSGPSTERSGLRGPYQAPLRFEIETLGAYKILFLYVDTRKILLWSRNRTFSYELEVLDWHIEYFPVEPEPPKFLFKVIGVNTGTVYFERGGLDECPAVDNQGCVMGEERSYETMLPDQVPGGLVESSCFIKVVDTNNSDCFHVILETKTKDIPDKLPSPPKYRAQLYLCGLPGCPAEYRIECCPDYECEPERCPPDTDCQLDCGNFICCYKNGKVIKTIYK